jgi:hypothetical protein
MRIDGSWLLCDDGVVRPVILGEALAAGGTWVPVTFLVDSGADRTVFSADTLRDLALPALTSEEQLGGVGGQAASVAVETKIRLTRETATPVVISGRFSAFTDPKSMDMSVLGRDITNLFALIIDRPQEVVCLLSQNHRYAILTS